jgi:hypothetical protein
MMPQHACPPDLIRPHKRRTVRYPVEVRVPDDLITLLISPAKKRALATTVSNASVLTRVRDVSDEPGSLNAMCPSA